MRYTIETVEDERDIGLQIARWEKNNKLQIIEKGEKFEMIKADLLKIRNALETLKKTGFDTDLMKRYIYDTTNGITRQAINDMLYQQKEFLKKITVIE